MTVATLHHDSDLEQISGLHVGANRIFFAGGLHAPVMLCTSNLKDFLQLDIPGKSGLRDVAMRADGTVWAVGEYGQILITDSFGEAWARHHIDEDACLQSVAVGPNGNAWVFGEHGFLAQVTASGEVSRVSISRQVTLAAMAVVGSVAVIPNYDGSVVQIRGEVELGWFSTGSDNPLCDIVYTKSGALVVCGDGGFIARSLDGGMTWRQATLRLSQADATPLEAGVGDLEALAVLGDGQIIAVGAAGRILSSRDDGISFTSIASGIDTHLRAIAPLAGDEGRSGAIIAGDEATVLWLGDDPIPPWSNREDILNRPRAFDDFFRAGPDGFIASRLPGLARAAAERTESLIDGDAIAKNLAHIEREAAVFEELYGHPMPATFVQFWRALASVPAQNVLSDLSPQCDVAPYPTENIFLALIERNQHSYLGIDLRNAFSGTFDIGLFDNGDRYVLECRHRTRDLDGTWVDDPTNLVYRYDHAAQAYSGIVARSLDAQAYLSALISANNGRLISPRTYRGALTALRGQVSPSDPLAMAERDPEFEPFLTHSDRNDAEYLEVRAMWIITLLKNDGVRTLEDLPHLFRTELNPDLSPEELAARLEVIPYLPPTALYVLWRAFLFAEPHLSKALALAQTSPARLVRDCATLVAELVEGKRTSLGTITDVSQWLEEFRNMDLDPRKVPGPPDVNPDTAELAMRLSDIATAVMAATDAALPELAWADLADPLTRSAIAQRLCSDPGQADNLERLSILAALAPAERQLSAELLAAELPQVYVPLLVGALMREGSIEELGVDEELAGELVAALGSARRLEDRGVAALYDCLTTATRSDDRRRRAVKALGATGNPSHGRRIADILDTIVVVDEVSATRARPVVTTAISALHDLASSSTVGALMRFAARQGESATGRFPWLDEYRGPAGLALARVLEGISLGEGLEELPDEILDNLFSVITEIPDDIVVAEASVAVAALAAQLSPEAQDNLLTRLGETVPAIKRPLVLLAGAVALGMDRVPGKSLGPGTLAEQIASVLYSSEPKADRYVSRARIIINLAERRQDSVDPEAFATLLDYPQREIRDGARALIDRLGIAVPEEYPMDRYAAGRLSDAELVSALSTPLVIGRTEVIREIRERNLTTTRGYLVRLATAILSRLPHESNVLNTHDAQLLDECLLTLARWTDEFDEDTAELFQSVLEHPNPSIKPVVVNSSPLDSRFHAAMWEIGQTESQLTVPARVWLRQFDQQQQTASPED